MPDASQLMRTNFLGLTPAAQRWAAVIVVLALAAAGGMWAVGQQQEQRSVLYSGLTPQGASRVITALESHHVPFQLAQDGAEILVAPERVAAIRMQLAGDGLPTEHVGFGLFDHLPLGASDTVERVDYSRALSGELAQAVEALGPVQSAQVLLALPQDSTFTSDQKPGHASVMVRLAPGASLTATQVKAITHLIASGAQGIDPSAVSVVDDAGHLLASGTGEQDPAGAGAASARTDLERGLETRVHDQIAALVTAVAGPNKSVIEVHAELTGAAVHTVVNQAAPGAPISQQQVQEQYTGGAGAVPPAPGAAAGAGAPPAAAGAPGKVPTYGTAAGGPGATSYNKTEQLTNFQIATQQTDTHDPGNAVRRI
ncbi:MAG: flagellar basal-body MS-ring/collar protein FliF, partial [bacterium]